MSIEPGGTLLHYRLVEKIGEGGMGVVWKAVDTTLDREVAIKILPEVFSGDPERLARFEREARLLASLNHPNIAIVHGLHESEGCRFLAMELVNGQDLASRLTRGPLPIEDALSVTGQIAAALEVAHANGVVHRDLKPANVVITPEGKAKVLDFGLAKTVQPDTSPSGSLSMSPTVTSAGTVAGVILGTAAYMSPEQARGKPVDRRADLWALGCVLYECLTGRQLFRGETVSDSLAAILRKEPDWSTLPEGTPALVRWLLRRSLTRDPAERLQDAGDARIELEQAVADPSGASLGIEASVPSTTGRPAGSKVPWLVAALMALLALGLLGTRLISTEQTPPIVRASLNAPKGTALIPFDLLGLALSPDGGRLAFVANGSDGGKQLWLRDLSTMEQEPVAETQGAEYPFWSPDGMHLGFFADGKLKRIDLRGGSPRVLADAPSGRGGSWGRDDRILFSPNIRSGIHSIAADGGDSTVVTRFDPDHETTHRWPHWLPGGQHFLYVSRAPAERQELGRLVLATIGTTETEILIEDSTNALYVEPGYLIYARAGDLTAWRFDLSSLQLVGDPEPVSATKLSYWEPKNFVPLAAADNGTIVYLPESSRRTRLQWYDRTGRPLAELGEPGFIRDPEISPDGTRIALVRGRQQTRKSDIWIHDLEHGREYRLTQQSGAYATPSWSPDSSRIAFGCVPKEVMDVCVTDANGSGAVEVLHESANWSSPGSWMPDGSAFLFSDQDPETENDLWSVPVDDASGPRLLLQRPFADWAPQVAPDGRRMLHLSNETGTVEVYVREIEGAMRQWQISDRGGLRPRWSRNGKEILYASAEGELISVSIETDSGFRSGKPTVLFELPERPRIPDVLFEHATADGERILLNVPMETRASVGFHAILNWGPRPAQ